MLPESRRIVAFVVAGLLVVPALLFGAPLLGAPLFGAQVAHAADGPVAVTDAVLRWGMSDEANNLSPSGAPNFFSAGRIAEPADGALTQTGWSQASGAVSIEKWNGTGYQPATWAGLTTDTTGTTIPNHQSKRYSGHQFVITGGTGTVDRAAGTAEISWDGEVSVLFYGGSVFFYLTDPTLTVADGRGTLRGTVSGTGASRDDPGATVDVAPTEVTLADLPAVDLAALGFTAVPAYDDVVVTSGGASVTGSFPQSFIDVMGLLGTAPFWHRTPSSSVNEAKKALPVTVSYDASDPVEEEPPPIPEPAPSIENEAPAPPTIVERTTDRTVTAPAPAVVPAPGRAPVVLTAGPTTTSPVLSLLAQPTTPSAPDASWAWWLGAALFAVAAVVAVGSLITPSPASRRPFV